MTSTSPQLPVRAGHRKQWTRTPGRAVSADLHCQGTAIDWLRQPYRLGGSGELLRSEARLAQCTATVEEAVRPGGRLRAQGLRLV